jgi:mRNA-degrading endonuclease toxin of MazEF toxin-antitoxin module
MAGGVPLRGEIWLAYTPGQPTDPHQPRPVLVISADVRNRNRDDVVVIPIFSRGRLGPTRVPLTAGSGGIDHDSVLFCEEITTIDRDFLADGPLGEPVPERILDHILRAVRRGLGEVVPEP